MGKGAVTGGSDLYMGTAALSERDYVHEAVERADLIVAIGHDTVEKPPFLMKSAGGPKVIHIGYQSATVEQVYHPDIEVIGDIGASVDSARRRGWKASCPPTRRMLELRQRILARINDRAEEDRFPPTPQRIVHDVRKVMPEDGIVCLDNGMYKIWFARNYRTHVANTLLLDNALATMGAGLPSAMMAAMLYPERRVMAVCGDGGFMMNSQEMETAVRLGLNLVVLILNDSAYGMIRWKQAVDGFPDFGMTLRQSRISCAMPRPMAPRARGSARSRISFRRSRRPLPAAASIWSMCRSTIPRTPACWSTSCATAAPDVECA